ncbi:MAG: hypothetical protein EB036_03690 [Betaproteobacteria bacterium]|nr:hypothetical protein [Betaproteobacteria bacterium]
MTHHNQRQEHDHCEHHQLPGIIPGGLLQQLLIQDGRHSIGITFPLNILLGIPLYTFIAKTLEALL